MDEDYLYHLGLEKKGDNLKQMFGDVKVREENSRLGCVEFILKID